MASAARVCSESNAFLILAHSKWNDQSSGSEVRSSKSSTVTVLLDAEIISNLYKYFAICDMNRSSMWTRDVFRNVNSDNSSMPVNRPLSNEKLVTLSNVNNFKTLNALSANAFFSISVNSQCRNVNEKIAYRPPNHFSGILPLAKVTFSIVKNRNWPRSTLHVYRTIEKSLKKKTGENESILEILVPQTADRWLRQYFRRSNKLIHIRRAMNSRHWPLQVYFNWNQIKLIEYVRRCSPLVIGRRLLIE